MYQSFSHVFIPEASGVTAHWHRRDIAPKDCTYCQGSVAYGCKCSDCAPHCACKAVRPVMTPLGMEHHPYFCMCEACKRARAEAEETLSEGLERIKAKNFGPPVWRCPKCPCEFKTLGELMLHYETYAHAEKPAEAPKYFGFEEALRLMKAGKAVRRSTWSRTFRYVMGGSGKIEWRDTANKQPYDTRLHRVDSILDHELYATDWCLADG